MGFNSLLERLGFVRLRDFGLILTEDRRIVTTRKVLDDGFGATVVGWEGSDLAAIELAPQAAQVVSMASARLPAPPVALAPPKLAPAPTVPMPPPPAQSPAPTPVPMAPSPVKQLAVAAFAPTVAAPIAPSRSPEIASGSCAPIAPLSVAPVGSRPAIALPPVEAPVAFAPTTLAAATPATPQPVVAASEPELTEDEWEWEIAVARARAEATVVAPVVALPPRAAPVVKAAPVVSPWHEDTAIRSVTQLARVAEKQLAAVETTRPRTIIPVPSLPAARTAEEVTRQLPAAMRSRLARGTMPRPAANDDTSTAVDLRAVPARR